MNIVLDTNQALKIPNASELHAGPASVDRLILAPYVIVEVLLRSNPEPTLSHLRTFRVRYGLEPVDVFERVAVLPEREIESFQPFVRQGDTVSSDDFYLVLKAPIPEQRERARLVKKENREFCESMASAAIRFRKKLDDGANAVRKCSTISEALDHAKSFHRDLVFESISNGSQRTLITSDKESLYGAVMRNQYLGRLFRTLLYYILSWSRLWADQKHNFDPSAGRDDWTDITLPLYAADGDVIVTEDAQLRKSIEMIEPTGRVSVKPAAQLQHYPSPK
ncbi:MAG TPA: hypothetical protein VGR36_10610 [Candidatus Acidoferrales bacterium]|nr:hypothetical protein [Candidatus Acidoferrales bacterium]